VSNVITHQPFSYLHLKPTQCGNEYGVPPCTASGSEKCYNTISTCQDEPNFTETTGSLKLCSKVKGFPRKEGMIPCIVRIDDAPTTITGGRGIGARARITLTVEDFPHDDRGLDPYVDERTHDTKQGTFWGKWLARNPFYQGREAISGYGSLSDPFDINSFNEERYIIESISNPDSRNHVKIVLKDSIKKLDSKRAVEPEVSTGELFVAMTDTDVTLTLGSGQGSEYLVDEYVTIGDEILLVTGITNDDLNVSRAQWGTDATEHKINSKVQICKSFSNVNLVDIIHDLATSPNALPASYINKPDWDTERDEWVPSHNLTAIIPKPTPIETSINQLIQLGLLDIWDDAEAQTLRLKASSPYRLEPIVITDSNIVQDSMVVKDLTDQRITRTWIQYAVRNPLKKLDEAGNIGRNYQVIDGNKESSVEYNDIRAKVYATPWLTDSQADRDHAFSWANRLVNRFSKTPKQFEFRMYANDTLLPETGAVIKISTRKNQDEKGLPKETIAQIMERKPIRQKGVYQFRALAYNAALNAGAIVNNISIAADQMNYNLWLAVGSPPDAIEVTVTIEPGVVIGSVDADYYAFQVGSFAEGSVINIINTGKIKGAGGNGGRAGGRGTYHNNNPAEPVEWPLYGRTSGLGQQGGGAISAPAGVTINITNTSALIASGNGGEDGEFQAVVQYFGDPDPDLNTTGGAGGDGFNPGIGGEGYRPDNQAAATDGADGQDNELTAGLGLNPGFAIDAPDATVNIIDAGTINGPTNY